MATLNTTYQMVELIDPMICSRFYVKFLNKNLNIEPHTICKIDLPKFSNGEWQDLNIEFLNFVDCNTVEQLSKIVSSPNTTYCIQINLLDPVGNEVGKWNVDAKIKNVDFGTLDYADNKEDSLLKSIATFSVLEALYVY